MLGLMQHRHFSRNTLGRDFFVADVHGERVKLSELLQSREFDTERDRCFALGDLIDRGPDSPGMLQSLDEGWFFSIAGNHELMFLEARNDTQARWNHLINGGQWTTQPGIDLESLAAMVRLHCALAFTVETACGTIGLCHATAPASWSEVQHTTLGENAWHDLVWDRFQYRSGLLHPEDLAPVRGVDLVLHGHVSCESVLRVRNRIWMDTLFRGGGLSLFEARELFSLPDTAET